ncbi:MAG: hypothetical protein RJA61_498 [Candidatus Parcubacteria bacterium]|jgi:hypothetical protein
MTKFFAIVTFSLLALALGGCTTYTTRHGADRWNYGTPDTGASVQTGFRYETGREHSQEFYAKKQQELGTHIYSETHYSRPIKGGPVVTSTISRGEEVRYHYGTPLPVTGVTGREAPPVLGGIADFFKGIGADVEYSKD